MYKILLLFLILGIMTVSCTEALATVTPVPPATPSATIPSPELVREIKLETQTGTAYTLDWSHDGETLAAGSGYEITLLDHDLGGIPTVITPDRGALGVAWSPAGDQLATVFGYRNPEIVIWDLDRDAGHLVQMRELDGGADQYGVSWSPDGKLLATLGDDDKATIQIWDTNTWQEIHRYELPYLFPRRALNWSQDSAKLYDAGELDEQAVAFVLHVSDGSVQEIGKFSIDQLYVFAVSPDEKTIAFADERGVLQFVEIASGKTITVIKTVDQPVDLAWSPDGGTLAVLAYKTALQLWDLSP